jgi:2-(1,2-epoxy-1,2-dihydrophenyl)acetyl-CoA isomerase
MSFATITLDMAEGVATLTLNRPQLLNALTTGLVDDVNAALDQIVATGSGVRCLLITGSGRGFSSGADLATGIDMTGADIDVGSILESHYNPLFLRLADLPIPIVTAVNGAAAGAGCSLALAGDIVVAGRSAYFLQAFVNIGLVPDVASSWLLPRLIGKARAQAMMMLGERISAEKAEEWGMIYEVVDDAMLEHRAGMIARKLAAGPTRTHAIIRRGIRFAMENDVAATLERERQDQLLAGRTADFMEGVSAFLAKRPAAFTGK